MTDQERIKYSGWPAPAAKPVPPVKVPEAIKEAVHESVGMSQPRLPDIVHSEPKRRGRPPKNA